jgi:hypothetical protein
MQHENHISTVKFFEFFLKNAKGIFNYKTTFLMFFNCIIIIKWYAILFLWNVSWFSYKGIPLITQQIRKDPFDSFIYVKQPSKIR